MLKVGLTGGIAAGKSVVGEMFVALGAHLVQADRIAHSLMLPGEAVYNQVVRHFGGEILNPDLSINRAKLAEAAFGSPADAAGAPASTARQSRIAELNRIVHPAVIRSQDEWMQEMGRQDPHAVAMVEAALILEAGDLESARREVNRRMAAQLPDEEKIKAAHYVIDNSGALDRTREQVRQVWQKLRAEAEASRS